MISKTLKTLLSWLSTAALIYFGAFSGHEGAAGLFKFFLAGFAVLALLIWAFWLALLVAHVASDGQTPDPALKPETVEKLRRTPPWMRKADAIFDVGAALAIAWAGWPWWALLYLLTFASLHLWISLMIHLGSPEPDERRAA